MSGPPVLDLQMTSDYERQWGVNAYEYGPGAAFYRPQAASGYFILGDHCQSDENGGKGVTVVVRDDGGAGYLAPPTGYSSLLPSGEVLNAWAPVAPSGYVALGCVATASGVDPESITNLRCVRQDLVRPVAPGAWITWWDHQNPITFYSVPGTGLFQGQSGFPIDAPGIPIPNTSVSDSRQELQKLPPSVEVWVPNNL